jgi:hypothetical protein
MHIVSITLFLVSITNAADPTSRAVAKPSTRAALPRVLSPATPPTAVDVTNSITNWQKSIDTVNDYLNNPTNSTKLASAIVFAKDEPVQLATLMKVPAMSKTGINAGKVLMANFGSIISNLNSIQSGVMSTQDATAAVNFNRCCTVLPAIGALWTAASNATKVATPMMPNLEDQCSQMSCASGTSGKIPGNSTTLTVVTK